MTKKRARQIRLLNYCTGIGYFLLSCITVLALLFGAMWIAGSIAVEAILWSDSTGDTASVVKGAEATSLGIRILGYSVAAVISIVSIIVCLRLPRIVGAYWNAGVRALLRRLHMTSSIVQLYGVKILISLILYGIYVVTAIGANVAISYELVVFGGCLVAAAAVLFSLQYVAVRIFGITGKSIW